MPPSERIVWTHAAGFRYGATAPGAERWILDSVDLSAYAGECLALMGESGVGKSTLARVLARHLRPTLGDVSWAPSLTRSADIVYLDQDALNFLFPWQTVRINAIYPVTKLFSGEPSRCTRIESVLDALRLSQHANAYPLRLSGGQRQRAALARALAFWPKVLILDEAFAALDHDMRHISLELINTWRRAEGMTIILVSHSLTDVLMLADRCIVLGGTPARPLHTLSLRTGDNASPDAARRNLLDVLSHEPT